jgi:hypothetical protein
MNDLDCHWVDWKNESQAAWLGYEIDHPDSDNGEFNATVHWEKMESST